MATLHSPTHRGDLWQAWMALTLTPMLATAAWAGQASSRIEASINGMVCSFCVQGIEHKLLKLPATESVSVDIQKHRVNITLRKGSTISDNQLRQVIRDAGFDVRDIKRIKPTL